MEGEIRPEPSPEEAGAMRVALVERADALPAAYASRWRVAGLPLEDDYDVTARPRSRLGATRA